MEMTASKALLLINLVQGKATHLEKWRLSRVKVVLGCTDSSRRRWNCTPSGPYRITLISIEHVCVSNGYLCRHTGSLECEQGVMFACQPMEEKETEAETD